MLSLDERKLRWLGIDMRPRWRRRVAVVATYTAFLVVVWVHPRWAYGALESLWLVWFVSRVWSTIKEAETGLKVAFTALWAFSIGAQMWQSHGKASPVNTALYATFLMAFASVLSWAGMAALTDSGWLAQVIQKGEGLNWRQQLRLARMGFAVGLDGFAWYEFGVRFRRLNEEQRAEVEELRRANPRGKWMHGGERVLLDDERIRQEENLVRAKVQRVMNWVLVLTAIWVSAAVMQGWMIRRSTVVSGVWTLVTLMITLRQAIVLWSVEDPGAASGELGLVEQGA